MYLTNRIKAEFESKADKFDELAKMSKQLEDSRLKEIQAFNGGCRDYETMEELEYNYNQARKELTKRGDKELHSMQDSFDSMLETSLAIDPKRVEYLTGGVLKLNNLSDNDLMNVAKKDRHSYSTLMVIADYATDHESEYAKNVARALKKYIEVVTDSTKRIIGSCKGGYTKQTNYPGARRGFCDGYIEDVQRADDCLQSAIDGEYVEFSRDGALVSALKAVSK